MGKSPGTVAGSIVKNRENKLRRIAASKGMRLVKYPRDSHGRPYALAYRIPVPDPYFGRAGRTCWAPPGSKLVEKKMTLDEVEQLLRAGEF